MNKPTQSPRLRLVRHVSIFQIKLFLDGLRDALLIPVSLLAGLLGLLRGGEDAGREFQCVLELGRRSERWINVFGHEPGWSRPEPVNSLDHMLARVETAVIEQYRKGRDVREAQAAIKAAVEDSGCDTAQQREEGNAQ